MSICSTSLKRRLGAHVVVIACAAECWSAPAFAQRMTACDLLPKAEAEAIAGVTFLPPKPYGKNGSGCEYDPPPGASLDQKKKGFTLEVMYWDAPNPHAVETARKWVYDNSHDTPTDVQGLGDAAFWAGRGNSGSLYVFRGGTMRILVGPSAIGLEKSKEIALKALGGPTGTGYVFTSGPTGLTKPVLPTMSAKPGQVEQLKRDLTARADAGDGKAQLALATLYQFGTLSADGRVTPDYAGAAYWYKQASDHGEASAAYQLALIYRDGLGVPANPSNALDFFLKAAEAGFLPAMAPLAYAYAAQNGTMSRERATLWADKAAKAGVPEGWLILGYEYNKGLLIGERSYQYHMAMEAYKKAADGGNCVAMMNIGGLYYNGDGVPQDRNQAQSWFAKAEACQGQGIDWVRAKSATYRERAAAGTLPAPETSPRPQAGSSTGLSERQQYALAMFAAAVAVAMAIDLMTPRTRGEATDPGSQCCSNPMVDISRAMDLDRESKVMACGWTCADRPW